MSELGITSVRPKANNTAEPHLVTANDEENKICVKLNAIHVGENEQHSLLYLPLNVGQAKQSHGASYSSICDFESGSKSSSQSTYNIVMLDTSTSMTDYVYRIIDGFNDYIAPFLDGNTDIYTFSTKVKFKRSTCKLEYSDFDRGRTNLTGAIRKISRMIRLCPHKHTRVFFVTDGYHNTSATDPETVISKIKSSKKRIDFYLIGVGNYFPVKYSLKLRSKLHRGPSSISTLFWVKESSDFDVDAQMRHLKEELVAAVRIKSSIEFFNLPHQGSSKTYAYPGEYLYFPIDPNKLRSELKLELQFEPKVLVDRYWRRNADLSFSYYSRTIKTSRSDEEGDSPDDDYHYFGGFPFHPRHMMSNRMDFDDFLDMDGFARPIKHYLRHADRMSERQKDKIIEMFERQWPENSPMMDEIMTIFGRVKDDSNINVFPLEIENEITAVTCLTLLNELFKQWCAIMTHMHHEKKKVPMNVFDFMKQSFDLHVALEATNNDDLIKDRLARKNIRALQVEFATMMNSSRNVIAIESAFKNELELAEAVLKTTVRSKFDLKLLKIKGHIEEDWKKDALEFVSILRDLLPVIQSLPNPTSDECCRILMGSFLSDLKDPEIFNLLEEESKFDFLKNINFTGIPVLFSLKDHSQINPWTLHVENILKSPYEILSQRVLETTAELSSAEAPSNKQTTLKWDDPSTTFNSIVPIVPNQHAQVLKPLIRTNVFAVASTFCILKNANIIDQMCHIAALGCVWMRTIVDFPLEIRPDYIRNRISNIEATAHLYTDRHSIKTYIKCLLQQPELALCTEAEEKFNNLTIRCESLVKPAFFLHLVRFDYDLINESKTNLPKVIQRILMEFFGRCLSNSQIRYPYIELFLPSMYDDSRNSWITIKAKEVAALLYTSGKELFKKYSDLFLLEKGIKIEAEAKIMEMMEGGELAWQNFYQIQNGNRNLTLSTGSDRRSFSSEGADETMEVETEQQTARTEREGVDVIPAELIVPKPNLERISHFRRGGSVGQVALESLKAWVKEMLHDHGFRAPTYSDDNSDDDFDEALKPLPMNRTPNDNDSTVKEDESRLNLGARASKEGPAGATGYDCNAESGSAGSKEVEKRSRSKRHMISYLIQDDVDFLFGDEMLSVYILHALNFPESRRRVTEPPPSVHEASQIIRERLESEWQQLIRHDILPVVVNMAREDWLEAYRVVHNDFALPLSRSQIIERAQAMGIDVNAHNFSTVYRYRPMVGLCSNACQVESCPYFLRPIPRFNAHLEVERTWNDFVHRLHLEGACNVEGNVITMYARLRSANSDFDSRVNRSRDEFSAGIEEQADHVHVKYKAFQEQKKSSGGDDDEDNGGDPRHNDDSD